MITYRVFWTSKAQDDLDRILKHISENHPKNSKKIFKTIRMKAQSLSKNPKKGRVLPELKNTKNDSLRELIINPWRLIFKIIQKKVFILAFIDSRRDLEDILFERLTSV